MKKLIFTFLFWGLSAPYCAFGGTLGGAEDGLAQIPDSLQKEIVSDSAQKISEEEFIDDDEFNEEVLKGFTNQDEISSQDIDDSFVNDFGDILKTRGALNVIQVGPPGQPKAIFWGGGRTFRIFIDGMLYEQQALYIPQTGILDLNSIPLENVERIEIFPSGMANLWGKGSGSGVINIITKDYKGGEPYSRVTVGRGPDRYRGTQVELGRAVTSRGKIHLTAGFKESNGYLTNSDYDATTLSGRTTLRLKDNLNLRLLAYRYKTKMGLPLFSDAAVKDVRKKEDDWGITGNLFFRQNGNSLLRLDLRHDKGEQEAKSRSSGFEIKKMIRRLSVRAIQTMVPRRGHNLKLEAYAEREKYQTVGCQRIGYTEYFSLTDIVNLNQKTNFLVFSKIENDDEFKTDFSASGGVSYRIPPDLDLFSTIGRFASFPSSMDLHWEPLSLKLGDTIPDYREEGNPDLKAQKSTIFDFGADLRRENYRVSCLFFKDKMDDSFYWAKADTSIAYGYWRPVSSEADVWGVNFNSVLHFLNHFKSSVSYCYKESKDVNRKLYLPNSPRHSLFGYLQYENEFLKREIGLKLRLETNILSERFLAENERDKEPGVAIFNGKITVRFLDFHFYYVAENITDQLYRLTPYFPMPRRSWWWGFYWEFFD